MTDPTPPFPEDESLVPPLAFWAEPDADGNIANVMIRAERGGSMFRYYLPPFPPGLPRRLQQLYAEDAIKQLTGLLRWLFDGAGAFGEGDNDFWRRLDDAIDQLPPAPDGDGAAAELAIPLEGGKDTDGKAQEGSRKLLRFEDPGGRSARPQEP